MKPTISVVIPTYNRSHFIKRAVHSALAQTYQDLEVIVVDDHSTDDTVKEVTDLSSGDDRVRYLHHSVNRGAQAARNTGIRAAQGQYIAFLDSDDEWLPHKLEKQVQFITRGPEELGVVYCGYRIVRAGNFPPKDECFNLQGNIYHHLLSGYGLGPTSILLVKKKALEAINLFDESVLAYQEWDTSIRLAKYYEFGYVPNSLVLYHLHDQGSISRNRASNIEAYLRIVNRYRSDILCVCSQRTLDNHYKIARRRFFGLASQYLNTGEYRTAARMFAKAAQLPPAQLRLWLHASAVLLAPVMYQRLSHWKKGSQNQIKVSRE